MTLTRRDAAATLLTVLAVLVFIATHEGWDVPLVGDSHRWAAGAIALLGMATCGCGRPGEGAATRMLAVLGVIAFVLAIVAIATGSLTPLSLLVADIVLLWLVATLRHASTSPRRPLMT